MKTAAAVQTEDLIPTRYSLLSRLQNWDDQNSWRDFFETYWRFIYSVAIKSGLTEHEAEDVVQETVISVAKHIQKFKRDRSLGSFKGWLRNIVRWRIADQFEQRSPVGKQEKTTPDDSLEDIPDLWELPDPAGEDLEHLWDEEWRTNLFQAAVRRVKQKVREEHYIMFDLCVAGKWSPLKVAAALGVSVGQVYVNKHRISVLIKKEIRALEKQPVRSGLGL